MGNRLKNLLKCNDANHLCDKFQYGESSFLERLKLRLHLSLCKACQKYSENNVKLSSLIEKSKVKCLDKDYKAKMKQAFEKALHEHKLSTKSQ